MVSWWCLLGAFLLHSADGLMRCRIPRLGTTRHWSSSNPSSVEYFKEALLIQGPVTAGYGRGSKKLGVPTANLPHFDEEIRSSSLVNGVYFGWGCLPAEGTVWGCVANIGKSPTFVNQENPVNIIEAHLLGRDFVTSGDFYGSRLRLCLIGFLREEKKFSSFDALIAQINADISLTRDLTTALNCGELQAGKRIAENFFARKVDSAGEEALLWEKMSLIL